MKKEINEFDGLRYIVSYPSNYTENQKYPIILFLHGAGSRGEDITIIENNPYFSITDKIEKFPFVTIAPQCHQNTWFDVFETLKRFVVHITNLDFVDANRFYLLGASMGGYATWQLAMSMPECFAAIVPICGGGMYWNASRLANVPVWAFHGGKDDCVYPEESQKMVEAVNESGGNAKLTIYPENKHDAWSDTYSNLDVYSWLLSKEKKQANSFIDVYNDSCLFG